jgi:ribosome modulation factor
VRARAGLAVGFWPSLEALQKAVSSGGAGESKSGSGKSTTFSPQISLEQREQFMAGWRKAVPRSIGWLESAESKVER